MTRARDGRTSDLSEPIAQLGPEEQRAAKLLSRTLGAIAVVPRDIPPAQATHDFDIVLSDRSVVAVEVTQSIDGDFHALLKARHHQLDGIAGTWELLALPNARIRRHRHDLARFISELEQQGVTTLFLDQHSDNTSEQHLARHGFEALRWLSDEPGGLKVGPAAQCGSFGGDTLADVATELATLEDNRRKLETASASERHLFVWVDFSKNEEMVSLMYEPLPINPPFIPGHIDRVWIAGSWDAGPVISYSEKGGWASHPSQN